MRQKLYVVYMYDSPRSVGTGRIILSRPAPATVNDIQEIEAQIYKEVKAKNVLITFWAVLPGLDEPEEGGW